MGAKKVLLSGPVKGKFQQLFKRVAAVNKANGPFDILLCVGNPLPESGEHLSLVLDLFSAKSIVNKFFWTGHFGKRVSLRPDARHAAICSLCLSM